jgi:hypothetical protein
MMNCFTFLLAQLHQLKPKCNELLQRFVFTFNLRRFTKGSSSGGGGYGNDDSGSGHGSREYDPAEADPLKSKKGMAYKMDAVRRRMEQSVMVSVGARAKRSDEDFSDLWAGLRRTPLAASSTAYGPPTSPHHPSSFLLLHHLLLLHSPPPPASSFLLLFISWLLANL